MKDSKKVVSKYHKKLAKALLKLRENAWYGRVWGEHYRPNDGVTIVQMLKYNHYIVAADINLSSKSLFETILEGSNAPTFKISTGNCRVTHDSFSFKCTVKYTLHSFMGNPMDCESVFTGTWKELHEEYSTFKRIINVKVI